ncbi:MAG TPA: hypothetical protein VGQ59_14950 [Cyclobacteriaceae bacterium]|jgi:hypothetical protein|nr:hypothetical protein [Cyclobacteriaceae bacterium]
MKRLLFLLLSVVALFSCSNKESHEEESGDWKELNAFHKIMAKAFHPLKDSEDIAPTKQLIKQLADEADDWSNSELPEKVNTPEMKEKLQKLKTDARSLENEIQNGASDNIIKEKMNQLHDQFHKIMESWHSEETEDENENH